MKDSLGRTIDYLRISVTDRCNFRCIYCMPEEGIKLMSHDEILRLEEIERIVRVAADLGFRHIRLTGGEPLVRLGIVNLIDTMKHDIGIDNISLTTNGFLLGSMAHDLKAAGLDRINMSLDTLDPEQFHEITRCGDLNTVLAGLEAALAEGFDPVKINAVAVRGLNQDFYQFARMSVDSPLHMRFIEYMPVGESTGIDGCGWGPEEVITCKEIYDIINARAAEEGTPQLEPVDAEHAPLGFGPAQYYRFPGAKGTVGFISPLSNHFCNRCNRLRLTADGKLRPCLFSDDEYDLRRAVREGSDEDIANVFRAAVEFKPVEHYSRVGTARKMSQIGG